MTRRNLKTLVLATAIVTPLEAFQYAYLPPALFYLLFPGDILELLITGPHGGTRAEDAIAPFVGFVANVCAYWLALTIGDLAFNWWRNRRSE
jgi:hypothetical protein